MNIPKTKVKGTLFSLPKISTNAIVQKPYMGQAGAASRVGKMSPHRRCEDSFVNPADKAVRRKFQHPHGQFFNINLSRHTMSYPVKRPQ